MPPAGADAPGHLPAPGECPAPLPSRIIGERIGVARPASRARPRERVRPWTSRGRRRRCAARRAGEGHRQTTAMATVWASMTRIQARSVSELACRADGAPAGVGDASLFAVRVSRTSRRLRLALEAGQPLHRRCRCIATHRRPGLQRGAYRRPLGPAEQPAAQLGIELDARLAGRLRGWRPAVAAGDRARDRRRDAAGAAAGATGRGFDMGSGHRRSIGARHAIAGIATNDARRGSLR